MIILQLEPLGEKIGDGMNQVKDMNLGNKINVGEVMENAKNVIGDQVENLGDVIATNTMKDINLENAAVINGYN